MGISYWKGMKDKQSTTYNHLFNNDKSDNPPKPTVHSFNKIWAHILEVEKTHAPSKKHTGSYSRVGLSTIISFQIQKQLK